MLVPSFHMVKANHQQQRQQQKQTKNVIFIHVGGTIWRNENVICLFLPPRIKKKFNFNLNGTIENHQQ